MQKTKTITFDGLRFAIHTVVETPARTLVMTGEPMVAVYGDYVQLGCMRITHEALRALGTYLQNIEGIVADGLVIQSGTYTTRDPNTITP